MGERSILITGCASGIGADAAHALAARGWRVLATCRRAEDCARLREAGLESFVLDYADPASIEAAVTETLARTGARLDALFNNGAFALPGAIEDVPRGGLAAILETNLLGVHDLTRRVLPAMRAQGFGRIVNCSSVLGMVPIKWRGAYVVSKYALEGLTDVLRLEMRDTPVRVITLAPGPVATALREKSIPHFERWVDWERSARADQYRASLLKRLYAPEGTDVFELTPDAVTRKLIRAVEHPRPRPRYHVTVPTHAMAFLRRLLPPRALDWVVAQG